MMEFNEFLFHLLLFDFKKFFFLVEINSLFVYSLCNLNKISICNLLALILIVFKQIAYF